MSRTNRYRKRTSVNTNCRFIHENKTMTSTDTDTDTYTDDISTDMSTMSRNRRNMNGRKSDVYSLRESPRVYERERGSSPDEDCFSPASASICASTPSSLCSSSSLYEIGANGANGTVYSELHSFLSGLFQMNEVNNSNNNNSSQQIRSRSRPRPRPRSTSTSDNNGRYFDLHRQIHNNDDGTNQWNSQRQPFYSRRGRSARGRRGRGRGRGRGRVRNYYNRNNNNNNHRLSYARETNQQSARRYSRRSHHHYHSQQNQSAVEQQQRRRLQNTNSTPMMLDRPSTPHNTNSYLMEVQNNNNQWSLSSSSYPLEFEDIVGPCFDPYASAVGLTMPNFNSQLLCT